ncbi:hypothetical protein GC207_05950 [bacterium]|nr:hypothetical protein [bacterium]
MRIRSSKARGKRLFALTVILPALSAVAAQPQQSTLSDAPQMRPVPYYRVALSDPFWKPRIESNRTTSLPMMYQLFVDNHNLDNFKKAAGRMTGDQDGFPWADSDVYKTLEGMVYANKLHPDPEMEQKLEAAISDIAAAQRKDGYLDTYIQLGNMNRGGGAGSWGGVKPADGVSFQSWELPYALHESYCMGHLIEAAVADYDATGRSDFLNIARKSADYLFSTCGPSPKTAVIPGHQGVELALMRLWSLPEKGRASDLEVTKYFLDERGRQSDGRSIYGEFSQDLRPVRQETEPLGHCVRGAYMWAAATDVAAATGDAQLLETMEKLWDNVVSKKMYVTGGTGGGLYNEGFGPDYDLSHNYAYNETCAACAMMFWTHRLAGVSGDSKYTDVFERILYNGFASGRSLDGTRLYYNNFVKRTKVRGRQGIVCCAGNTVRTVPSISGYQYATKADDGVWTHLYMAGKATIPYGDGEITIDQQTSYPWDGNVKLTFASNDPVSMTLHLRIPEWAKGATTSINGQSITMDNLEKGYLPIHRTWKTGDVLKLNFPMTPRRIYSDPKVWADQGRVAIARGPLVYCLESNDNSVPVDQFIIPRDASLTSSDFKADELGGVVKITGTGINAVNGATVDFTMIPYALWDNRTHDSGMVVMIPETMGTKEGPIDGGRATTARVTCSSVKPGDSATAVNDGILPSAWNGVDGSKDKTIPRFTWAGKQSDNEWIAYEFPEPLSIGRTDIFWAADHEETDFPKTFHIEYWENGNWKTVELDADYMNAVDLYSDSHFTIVRFKPVTTAKLRLVAELKAGKSSGILEWRLPY